MPKAPPVVRIAGAFQEFASHRAAASGLLLACAAAAFALANSRWAEPYTAFWHTAAGVNIGQLVFSKPLVEWVNDGLMAVFFFAVSLEIKRELLVGELSSLRQAFLPLMAALGGVLLPAAIYTLFNLGTKGAAGWGIPMATDIAFALGVMGMLGDRVPLPLKVFLTALAIVDDIVAVLVIALFYTREIEVLGLLASGIVVVILLGINRLGVRAPLIYGVGGCFLWLALLNSGVHATVSGVLLAMTVPVRTRLGEGQFLEKSRAILDHFARVKPKGSVIESEEQQTALQALEDATDQVQPPLHQIERALHPWVDFLVMPLFALANAGANIRGQDSFDLLHPVTLGVVLGLVIGKPLGITLGSWLSVRAGLARLTPGMDWFQLFGAAWLGGIGFTMSLFVANLAFHGSELLNRAKLGVLIASLVAGSVGYLILAKRRDLRE